MKKLEENLDLILTTLIGRKLPEEQRYWEEGSVYTGVLEDIDTKTEIPEYEIASWDTNELWRSLKSQGVTLDGFRLKGLLNLLEKDGYILIHEKSKEYHQLEFEITPEGIIFIENIGYKRQRRRAAKLERKVEKRIELQLNAAVESAAAANQQVIAAQQQLKIAQEQTLAATKTTLYTKYLLGATAITILISIISTIIVGFQAWSEYKKEEKPPVIVISDEVKKQLEQSQIKIQQLQDQLEQTNRRIPSIIDSIR